MPKDFKSGLIIGLVLLFGGLIWMASRRELSPEARLAGTRQSAKKFGQQPGEWVVPPQNSRAYHIFETTAQEAESESGPIDPPESQQEVESPHPAVTEPLQETFIAESRIHVVVKDETLSSIAYRYYGSANQWQRIYQANRLILNSPDRIKPGMKLLIPE